MFFNPKKVALFFASLALSYFGYNFIFNNFQTTLMLLISALLHEVGHAIFLYGYGYTSTMIFVPFLGAAVVPDDKKVLDKLPWAHVAHVVLAGCFVNAVLALIGLMLAISEEWHAFGLTLAWMNVTLIAVNLLPFWELDGGKFIKAIFNSMEEAVDTKIVYITTTIVSIVLAGVVISKVGLSPYYFLVVFGFYRASRKDNPAEAFTPRAMTPHHACWLLGFYCVILLSAIVGTSVIPPWTDVYGR